MRRLVKMSEAARQLGVHRSTIGRQVAAGIIPNRGTDAEPLVDVEEARQAQRPRALVVAATWIDGWIAYFAPVWALKRKAARHRLALAKTPPAPPRGRLARFALLGAESARTAPEAAARRIAAKLERGP